MGTWQSLNLTCGMNSNDTPKKEFLMRKHSKNASSAMPILVFNYLKIALRRLRRHKGHSFINIAGLAVGMAACILMLIWVQNELSYDRFHKNADQIYRINIEDASGGITSRMNLQLFDRDDKSVSM